MAEFPEGRHAVRSRSRIPQEDGPKMEVMGKNLPGLEGDADGEHVAWLKVDANNIAPSGVMLEVGGDV